MSSSTTPIGPASPGRFVSVYTTAADTEQAERLAQALLDERLVACANIVPGVVSLYRWQGGVQRDDEVVVFLKTRAELAERVCARIVELHAYDVPCALVLPIVAGAPRYLAWLAEQTGRG